MSQTNQFTDDGLRVPEPEDYHGQITHLADLTSRCSRPLFSAPNRVDPYWDGVWEIGSQASWERAELLRRKLDAGMDRHYLAPRFAGRDEALEYLTSSFSTDWLRMLGAVLMWRTMTSQQLAAITGADQNSGLSAPTIRAAFEAGLIDLGSWSSALRRASLKSDATWLVRPSRDSRQAFRHLSRHMTWPEWVSVTAGQDWSVGMQHSRHNALTVELALRLAEYADVGTVLGERLGTIDLLAGSGIGRDIYDADGRSADAVIVRPDGLRIAIETTASTSRILEAKMRRWAQTLAATPFQDSGLVVLWLFIEPNIGGGLLAYNRKQLRTRLRTIANQYPGRIGDRVAERMLFADWRHWFPSSHTAGDGFLTMGCQRPTGPAGDPWESIDLLGYNQLEFNPWSPEKMTEILYNAQGLAGLPRWIRDPEQGRQMWPELASRAGFDHLPVLPVKEGNRIPGQVPRRLMML